MNQLSKKDHIIYKSLEMFNELGVERITTRHIASELNISQGNLHYHYPNKNSIIETLFENLLVEIKGAQQFSGQILGAQNMLHSMQINFEIMYKYRLFFQQNDVIWRRIPHLKTKMDLFFNAKQAELKELIAVFKNEGKFRDEVGTYQIETLAEQLIFTIKSWLVIQYYEPKKQPYDYYAKFLFRLWFPYLNTNELDRWKRLLT